MHKSMLKVDFLKSRKNADEPLWLSRGDIIVPPTFPFKGYTLIYNTKIAKIIIVNEKCLNHLLLILFDQ